MSASRIGAIEGVVDHIFSFIDDRYSCSVLGICTSLVQPLPIGFVFRSNQYECYRKVLLGVNYQNVLVAKAALEGNLEGVKWARANGCPWDADACTNAARGGHMELLQWLHTNGCE
jgi:hypothetical protein